MQKDPKLVYVGNLPKSADYSSVHEYFIPFGDIKEIHIPVDPITQEKRGFAFVEYEEEEDAQHAIFNRHNSTMSDKTVVVEQARPTRSREMLQRPLWADEDYYQKYTTEPK